MNSCVVSSSSAPTEDLLPEEMHAVRDFLAKRFPKNSLSFIIKQLGKAISHPQGHSKPIQRDPCRGKLAQGFRKQIGARKAKKQQKRLKVVSILTDNINRLNLSEQIGLIAGVFVETGINYAQVRQFFPDLAMRQYYKHLATISSHTLSQIETFIVYECGKQLMRLTGEQTASLKAQLIKIRDWLSQRPVDLQTYFKFIRRYYGEQEINISHEDGIKLYALLVEIGKSPFVDALEQPNLLDKDKSALVSPKLNLEIENTIIDYYMAKGNFQETAVLVNRKWFSTSQMVSLNCQVTISMIRKIVRKWLKKALLKLIESSSKHLDELPVNFDCSRTSLDLLNDSQEASKVRISLLKFFQDRNIPLSALRTIYKMVFEFFSRQVIEKNVPRIILREP